MIALFIRKISQEWGRMGNFHNFYPPSFLAKKNRNKFDVLNRLMKILLVALVERFNIDKDIKNKMI